MSSGRSEQTRWALVKKVQDGELRGMTPDERFDQLVDLFALGPALPEDRSRDRELRIVRRRWVELRRRARA